MNDPVDCPPFFACERADSVWEIGTSQKGRAVLDNLHTADPLLKLAIGVWWSEHEAIAVANRLTEELFGREITHSEATAHGGEYDVG